MGKKKTNSIHISHCSHVSADAELYSSKGQEQQSPLLSMSAWIYSALSGFCFDWERNKHKQSILICTGCTEKVSSFTSPGGTPSGAGRPPRHLLWAAAPTALRPWLSAIQWSPGARAATSHCCRRRLLAAPCIHRHTHTHTQLIQLFFFISSKTQLKCQTEIFLETGAQTKRKGLH